MGQEPQRYREKIRVSDYVQWESQGVLQFKEPVPVSGFSDDGAYAFVEGTNTGLPLEELIKMETLGGQEVRHGSREGVTITPNPAVGRFSTRGPIVQMGMNSDTFTLDEGQVVLQWPAKMSPESYEDFKAWLDLISRKAKRAMEKKEESVPHQSK